MKGQFGEPWVLNADGAVHPDDGEAFSALWTHDVCGSGSGKMLGLKHHALDVEDSQRIVAAVTALDGLEPTKLGDFLDACKALAEADPGKWSPWEYRKAFVAAYDALTGEGE